MADLGLILGAALAGGVAGAGGAAKDALKSQQEYMQKDDLIHLQNQLDEQKQLRIQEAHQTFLSGQQDKLFGHEETMQGSLFAHDSGEKKLDRANVLDNTKQQGDNAMAVEQVRASTEMAIASMNRQTSLAVARMAHAAQSVQSDATGLMWSVGVGPDGNVTTQPLTGPDGKQLQGPKNIDAATGMFVKALTETADLAAKNGDTEGHDVAVQRMSMLLSGTPLKDVMGMSSTDVPPARALAALQTPEGQAHYADFKAKWPKFAAQMETGGTVPKGAGDGSGKTSTAPNPFASATSTGTPGTPPLPGNGPAVPTEQVNRPALVGGQLPPAAAGWQGRPEVTPPAGVAPVTPAAPAAPAPAAPAPTFAQSVRPPAFAAPAPNVLDPVGQGLITQQITQR
jgi:hypothetical protein